MKADSIVTDSESDEDEEPMDLPKPKAAKDRKPRASVSAEAFGEWNKKEDFVPPVHEKDDGTKDHIREKLRGIFMFAELDDKEMNICIDAMSQVFFQAGDKIIVEGETGDCYFVVESGTLDCGKTFKGDDHFTFFKTYVAGEAFGELALLYNAPRAASITATSEGSLWRLDRDTFNHIVKDAAVRRRNMYEDFLKKVPLLSTMDNYERVMISDAFKQVKLSKGDNVIVEGEVGDDFYFLVEGAAVAKKMLSGQIKVVKSYEPGDYFGERALIKKEPRAATIEVTSDKATFVGIEKGSFQ